MLLAHFIDNNWFLTISTLKFALKQKNNTDTSKSTLTWSNQRISQMLDQKGHKDNRYNFQAWIWCYKTHPNRLILASCIVLVLMYRCIIYQLTLIMTLWNFRPIIISIFILIFIHHIDNRHIWYIAIACKELHWLVQHLPKSAHALCSFLSSSLCTQSFGIIAAKVDCQCMPSMSFKHE